MTLSGRPLLDTRPDQLIFVDRVDEMSRIRTALNQGLNCLVVGERGSGKTSLVRALMFQARQQAGPADQPSPELLYVRGAGAENASELLARAADALARHLGDPPTDRSHGGPAEVSQNGPAGMSHGGPSGMSHSSVSGQIAELGERVGKDRELSSAGHVVVALDDAPSGPGNALFGVLRDELWSIDLRWLVTVATDECGALTRPPADAFFESQVELGPLPVGVSVEILRRRMTDPSERLLEEAAAIGGGNPRRLLDVVREFDGGSSKWSEFSAAANERRQALVRLGRSAKLLASELEALGGASASDDRLLSRMGWTRARAVQVLGELEEANLVTAISEKTGQGRPRKVYKVVSPAQFLQRGLGARGQGPAA